MAQQKKTQQQLLAEIVKNLGYKSYNDLPVRSSLEEKLIAGTLTVRESVVLDMYARGVQLQEATKKTPIGKVFSEIFSPESKMMKGQSSAPESFLKKTNILINSSTKSGFTPDTPFIQISNSREAMEKIAKATKEIDPYWSGVFQSLRSVHVQISDDAAFLYQNPKEKAAGLASAQQSRKSKKFKGFPPAKDAFPEIVAGLSSVDDATTKNALIASSLAPYRPGEIANLRLGKYDPSTIQTSTLPGYFDLESGQIIFPEGPRGNKAATNLRLDKNSILYQVLAAQAVEAESVGSDHLFPDMTTGKMTDAIRENITPRMEQFEHILGRPFDESKDFRKLVSSMIVGELGYPVEAEKMLGHTDAQLNDALTKIGQQHYISIIVRSDNPLAAVQLSFENMIGEAIGASTLNETAAAYGLDIPGFTDDTAKPITIIGSGGELTEKTVVQQRQMTAEELASLDARREEATANAREAAQQAEARALELEEQNLAKDAELQQQRADAAARRQEQRALSKAEQAAQDAAEKAERIKLDDEESNKVVDFFGKILGKKLKPVVTGIEAGLTALGLGTAISQEAEGADITPTDVAVGAAKELTVPGMIADVVPEAGEVMEEAGGFLVDPVLESAEEEAQQKGLAGDFEDQMERAFGIPR
jgi:hypothetical protein